METLIIIYNFNLKVLYIMGQNNINNMNYNQLVNNIKSLQQLEQDLYLDLEKLPIQNSNIEAQQDIVKKINDLAQTRTSLMEQLTSVYKSLDNNLTVEKIHIEEQITIINLMEKHLTQSRSNINNSDLNIQNLRSTEINTYFSAKYKEQFHILRIVVILCLPVLILAILRKRNIIPSSLNIVFVIIIFIIGVFILVPRLIDLYSRNNMVFDEYDFPFYPGNDGVPSLDVLIANEGTQIRQDVKDLKLLAEGECIGPGCCGKGMMYDNTKEICVLKDAYKEGFNVKSFLTYAELINLKPTINQLFSTDKSGQFYSN